MPRCVITRALAQHAWPGENPLGKEFWCDTMHFRVIGVMDQLARAHPREWGANTAQWTVFTPTLPGGALSGTYLLKRATAGPAARAARCARRRREDRAGRGAGPRGQQTLGDLRHDYFKTDRIMIDMLFGVIAAMLGVTALGIVGLASFWVGQRRKQIGMRRALGATRGDILRYFQTENFLIVTFGIVLGMGMAYGLNLLLMQHYELARLPFAYLPVGALSLWVLGQLSVLAPALRASRVPPVVATRTV